MSSHHIVREKQEPALYIHALGNFNEEYLGQLLEWSPMLIVNSTEYEKVLSLGLKVDIIAGQAGSDFLQENTRVIEGEADNSFVVLDFLVSEKYPAVNIIDNRNLLPEVSTYLSKIDIAVFTDTNKGYAIRTGFKVWKPKGSVFYVFPEAAFTASNLMSLTGGKYEVVEDGFVEFAFNSPYLLISELL